jgi:hypothetical protein
MQEGFEGLLRDETRPSRIPPLGANVAARVVALTQTDPPGEATHWTATMMAKEAGISASSVQRIWRAHGLQPHCVRQFKFSNDPNFVEKLHDVVGLYVNPPEHAIGSRSDPVGCDRALGFGSSFRRRQCRFFGRLGTYSPTAIVRVPSTAMTPMAMLVPGHIRIRCCTLWRRRRLVIRLGHRQILRHCNRRQCADNQGAAYKSDIHPRLRVLLQIRMPMLAFHSSTRWAGESGDNLCRQNDPNTVPRTRTAASAMMQVTITVITISK